VFRSSKHIYPVIDDLKGETWLPLFLEKGDARRNTGANIDAAKRRKLLAETPLKNGVKDVFDRGAISITAASSIGGSARASGSASKEMVFRF